MHPITYGWFHYTNSSLYRRTRSTVFAIGFPMVRWCLALSISQLTPMLWKFCMYSVNFRCQKFSKSLLNCVSVAVYWVTFIIRSFTFLPQIVPHSQENWRGVWGGSNWDCTPLSAWSMKLLHFLPEIRVMHCTLQAFTAPGYLAQRVQYEQRKPQSSSDGMLITNYIPLDQKLKNDWRCEFAIHPFTGRNFCHHV